MSRVLRVVRALATAPLFRRLTSVGPLLRLNHWIMDLSPFAHTPRLPGNELTATPLIWLALVGGALVALGLESFRRRDSSP